VRALERVAGTLSLGAAIVHGGLSPAHFAEWWGYGVVFAAAAVAQTLLGLALLLDAVDPAQPGARTTERVMLAMGIVGNTLLVALYLVTRTFGIPVGPGAGETEAIAPIDVATQAMEIGVIVLLVILLRRAWARES
jgi:hypothetical protein